ncbi:7494_t:CDS:2, partial [Gigaspora rosea]
EFCMSPFGNVCNNQTVTFFNTSLSNSISGDYEEFTIEYVNGSEITAIWVYDTIIINTQTFEQMQFGLPKDIKGTGDIAIPDTINGQIGLALSPNVSKGGSITFGGVDLEYIIADLQEFRPYVSRIYINGVPMNYSGTASFNRNYSNGSATVNCSISPTFDLSFEFENDNEYKWRLPLNSILKKPIVGDRCSISINGNAINNDSWVLGSAFIEELLYDHTFWISNHLVRGTIAQVAALRDRPDSWNWLTKPGAIAYGHSSAHDGFNLQISGVYSYWIVFGVAESTEQDKWRGRFDNKQDYCYHYTGNEFKWDVFPC